MADAEMSEKQLRQKIEHYREAHKAGTITAKELDAFMEALAQIMAGTAKKFDSFLVRRRSGFKTRHDAEEHETKKINSGVTVLAKNGNALQFANKTQAQKRAEETGGEVYQSPASRVFFVKMS